MLLASMLQNAGLAILGLLILAGVVVAVMRKIGFGQGKAEKLPYQIKAVLTPAEQSFFQVLRQCVDGRAILLSKIALSEAVEVKKLPDPKARQGFRNKIDRKHLDFVLCDPITFLPTLVIELDDSSHRSQRAQQRDRDKEAILAAAGIPILRVPAARTYDTRELTAAIDKKLTVAAPVPRQEAPVTPVAAVATAASSPSAEPAPSEMKCPKCGSPMARRTSRKGQNAGKEFWGCTAYPKCKTVIPIE